MSVSTAKRLASIESSFAIRRETILSPYELALRTKLQESLHAFIVEFWEEVEGEADFMDNWHLVALCEHLEAALEGRIKQLVVNIPFRCMKSLIFNIFFPAWCFIQAPSTKFFHLSGSFGLAVRDNIKCRRLIMSDRYQRYWGHVYQLRKDVNTSKRYETTKGGQKIIKSLMSSAIGEGGNFLIVDDPNTSMDIYSDVTRERANEYISSSFGIRSDAPAGKISCLIIIQQRLHERDVSGYLLSLGLPVVHVMLPMEYDPTRHCKTIALKDGAEVWEDPRKVKGELLWPQRFSRDYVDNTLKKMLRTSYNINCQLQQNPSSLDGGIFKKEWFRFWKSDRLPQCEYTIQSWDTALSTTEDACHSAVTTYGIFTDELGKKCIMLLNCLEMKLAHPDLRRFIINHYNNYLLPSADAPVKPGPRPDLLMIECAAGGQALIDDVRRAGIPVLSFKPKHHGLKNETGNSATSKIGRAHLASSLVEQGLVYLPCRPPQFDALYSFAQRFYETALGFPRSGSKDIVDSMSQAFIMIIKLQLVHYRGEEPGPMVIDWKNYAGYDYNYQ